MAAGRSPCGRRWPCCTGWAGPTPPARLRTRSRSSSTSSARLFPSDDHEMFLTLVYAEIERRWNKTPPFEIEAAQPQEETRRQEISGSVPGSPPVASCRGRHYESESVVGVLSRWESKPCARKGSRTKSESPKTTWRRLTTRWNWRKFWPGKAESATRTFCERMARSDELVDHDGETCGQCHNMILGAEVAREMIEAGEYEDVVSKWAAEAQAALGEQQVLQAVGGRKRRPVVTRIRRSRTGGGNRERQLPTRTTWGWPTTGRPRRCSAS